MLQARVPPSGLLRPGPTGGLKAALIAIYKSAVCCVKWSRGRDGGDMCPHTFEIQNSEVNNVQNAIIIQKAITKSSVGNTDLRQMRR
jgi:hypothetical protein